MAQIRQEINILDSVIVAAAGDPTSDEIVQLDTSQYNGTVTYYFEAVCSKVAGTNGSISLRRSGTSTDDATIANADIGTSVALVRTSAFTPPAGVTEYRVFVDWNGGTSITVKSARIVIIQNADTLTNTETQIEIGNYNTGRTAESATILTNPKYWKYDASKWDGTKTFYAEAVYDSGTMDTVSVFLYESADILAPSWSSVATIVSAAETTTPTRTRVSFTPTDGRWYTIFSLNGSMDNHDIYRAGIVVTSTIIDSYDAAGTGIGTGSDIRGWAQSFTGDGSNLGFVKFRVSKGGSPTGNITAALYAHSGTYGTDSVPTGSAIETSSNSIEASTVVTGSLISFNFSGSTTLTNGTKYCIALLFNSDNTNYIQVQRDTTTGTASGNNSWNSAGTWISLTGDLRFYVYSAYNPTKIEPQYLLANTLFAAGTALQTFLTDWDSTEWDEGGGSIAYTFQAEAANGSTSDVTLEEADGGGTVTNSTLTNIDNAQISSAMTMPADQNLDTKATTNAGDVAAARILVAYVFAAASQTGPPAPFTNTDLPFLEIMGVGN